MVLRISEIHIRRVMTISGFMTWTREEIISRWRLSAWRGIYLRNGEKTGHRRADFLIFNDQYTKIFSILQIDN
jgi:hypothetical protein